MKISRTFFLSTGLLLPIILAVLACSCGRRQGRQSELKQHGKEESDYTGRVLAMIDSDTLSSVDSLKLLQYAYQMAACDAQLYKLQNGLIRGYFTACNEKCEKGQCSDSDIISAAMVYALENDFDTAMRLCRLVTKARGIHREVDEVARLILMAGNSDSASVLMAMRENGEIKTPLDLAFLAILTIKKGMPPQQWTGIFDKREAHSDSSPDDSYSTDIRYAHAYAVASAGDIRAGFKMMPYYFPLARSFPPASFAEQVKIGDSAFVKKIYFPLALYVRKSIDDMLLKDLLSESNNPDFQQDVQAITALAYTKGLGAVGNSFLKEPRKTDLDPANPKDELVNSLKMAEELGLASASFYEKLRYPVSRAAFLKYMADHPATKGSSDLGNMIFVEIDSARARAIWEARVLLSDAMLEVAAPAETFRRMSNLGVSDLSVRNNSPEWLAIYARAGLEEGSQLSLVTQLIFNLSQHYPYTIGLYEIMQSYNHLCKYY